MPPRTAREYQAVRDTAFPFRYVTDPLGVDVWSPWNDLIARGEDDCETLTAFFACCSYLTNHSVIVRITRHHAYFLEDGALIDPSVLGGMRPPSPTFYGLRPAAERMVSI